MSDTRKTQHAGGLQARDAHAMRVRADEAADNAVATEKAQDTRGLGDRQRGPAPPKRADYPDQDSYIAAVREHGRRSRESGQQAAVRKMVENQSR